MRKSVLSRLLRRVLIATASLLGCAVALLLMAVLTSGGSDAFNFLSNQPPELKGVLPLIEDGGAPRHGYTWQYRVYSWKENCEQVMRRAGAELSSAGYVRAKLNGNSWLKNDDWGVMFEPGRSKRPRQIDKLPDVEWTTVTVWEPVSNNWLTHLRYALEPSD